MWSTKKETLAMKDLVRNLIAFVVVLVCLVIKVCVFVCFLFAFVISGLGTTVALINLLSGGEWQYLAASVIYGSTFMGLAILGQKLQIIHRRPNPLDNQT